MSLKFSISCY